MSVHEACASCHWLDGYIAIADAVSVMQYVTLLFIGGISATSLRGFHRTTRKARHIAKHCIDTLTLSDVPLASALWLSPPMV